MMNGRVEDGSYSGLTAAELKDDLNGSNAGRE